MLPLLYLLFHHNPIITGVIIGVSVDYFILQLDITIIAVSSVFKLLWSGAFLCP